MICGFFFSLSVLISSLLCIVDSKTMILFVFGAYETSVVSSVKAKTDSNAVCFFSTNSFGSSLRVFLTVHNSVRFCPSRNLASACDVKKLSVVMLRLEPRKPEFPDHLQLWLLAQVAGTDVTYRPDVEAIPVWLGTKCRRGIDICHESPPMSHRCRRIR